MIHQPETRKITDQDTALVEALQTGRMDLMPELVARYEKALLRFGLKMCGKRDEAEDLVQDTFLNVLKYLKHFRHETRFKNWLYRIAASACIKKRRKSKFAPSRELSLEEFLPADEHEVMHQTPLWAAMPLEQVLNDELGRQLDEGIRQLPEKYQMVLILRDIENFSTAETARILHLTPANIKVRLHRARLFLRDWITEYFNAEKTAPHPSS